MAHDLVIRDGLLVDGTGSPPRAADVVVDGDRITEVLPAGTADRARGSDGPSPSKRGASSKMPRPRACITSARIVSSSAPAKVPGTLRPSGSLCRSVREVEKPSAPAAMPSSSSRLISARSSIVGWLSASMDRSPIAQYRRAQWPTMPPTFRPLSMRPRLSMYSP